MGDLPPDRMGLGVFSCRYQALQKPRSPRRRVERWIGQSEDQVCICWISSQNRQRRPLNPGIGPKQGQHLRTLDWVLCISRNVAAKAIDAVGDHSREQGEFLQTVLDITASEILLDEEIAGGN